MIGIQFLHDKQIIHSDITLENLFLSKDFSLKIGDFGHASYFETNGGAIERSIEE